MSKPTIIPRDPSLIAVAKDGKFLGYADQGQIDREGLEVYAGEEPKAKPEPKPEPKPDGDDKGAKPEAVRKGPPKKDD